MSNFRRATQFVKSAAVQGGTSNRRSNEITLRLQIELPKRSAKGPVRRRPLPVPPQGLITLRLDSDLLTWLRSRKSYQAETNALVRAYMEAQRKGRWHSFAIIRFDGRRQL